MKLFYLKNQAFSTVMLVGKLSMLYLYAEYLNINRSDRGKVHDTAGIMGTLGIA